MNTKKIDEEAIFHQANDLKSEDERTAYLIRVCGTNSQLISRVKALLYASNVKNDLLDNPLIIPDTPIEDTVSEGSGTPIGPYTLKNKLGEGGMGTVYLAEQTNQIKRRVALKIIKPGMDSKQVLTRFEMERQALALLDHPNIAHVLDAGTTEKGRPYFVMEFVAGLSITEHCDECKLSIEDRLGLFVQVCNALDHAHQKGIIHRDIKPSNILVTIQEGQAVPKIIDFGVAKAINQSLAEHTAFTEQGQIIGTPEYMSPEQAGMTANDIDTRSDIYSLGVLLYELLTGTLPFDAKSLREAAFYEIQRIICEEEPPKPSTNLSRLGDEAQTVAQRRSTEVSLLTKRLQRELEWIPLKAIRKDRQERYRSASELADDIQHYLKGEPLIAGPESTQYRVKKFVRRHQALVLGIFSVLMVLTIGIIGTTTFAIRESRARSAAEKAQLISEESQRAEIQQRMIAEQSRIEAEVARTEAERQAKIAQAVNGFLNNDLLASANPDELIRSDISVREILGRASEKIQDKFNDEPLIAAAIQFSIGNAYYYLGDYELAESHLNFALEIYEARYGLYHPETTPTLTVLCWLYKKQGKYAKAESLNRELLDIKTKLFGPKDKRTLNTQVALAASIISSERAEEAISLLVDVIEIKRLQGNFAPIAKNNLALKYMEEGRYEEAEPWFIEALEDRIQVGSEKKYLSYLLYKNNLATLYIKMSRYGQAEELLQEIFDSKSKALGGNHGETLKSMNRLGRLWATCPEGDFRNGVNAVEYANTICELTSWEERNFIDTLAAAYAEINNFTAAIKWQQKAIDLIPANGPSELREESKARLELYRSGKPYREGK